MEPTETQIRSRPVVLDLNYGANTNSLHYTIASPYAYDKFSSMTAKQAVSLVLDHHENRDPDSMELERKVRAFIEGEKDLYSIQLSAGTLQCEVDRQDNVKTDRRNENLKKYLEDTADAADRAVWAASMYLIEKTILG